MESAKGRLEEVIYETPDSGPEKGAVASSGSSPALRSASTVSLAAREGIDTSAPPVRDAFSAFARKEAEAADAGSSRRAPRRPADYEALSSRQPGARALEPPEQRLTRLQAEVAELLLLAERSAARDGPAAAAELLGGDASEVATELKVLEKRLAGLTRDAQGSPFGQASGGTVAGCTMPGSLVAQLERLASAPSGGAAKASGDGRVTYEISYAPNTAAIADSAKIAAMESSIADIEKQLGVADPSSFAFSDLQSAVTLLQKRLSLLDPQTMDTISNGVGKVMKEIEQLLAKKAELDGGGADKELDQKVSQLYDFCHRWSATAASLPAIVSRLQSLQALHLESTSFSSRLVALEKQQDELTKLLETTSGAVQELGVGLQENTAIVRDNMRSLEEKISKVVRS